jgi:ABC-type Mn2+/Zn2+ transport system permease subunit
VLEKLWEILSLDFPLRNSLYASLLIGAVVPLVGVHLVLGRRVIMAVALPQGATLGVALALLVGLMCGVNFGDHDHEKMFFGVALLGALLVMGLCLLWEAVQHARFGIARDAESAGIYAIAAAGVMALAASRAVPELGMLDVLRGEILAVSDHNLIWLASGMATVTVVLLWLRHALVGLLFDPALMYTSHAPAKTLSFINNLLVCTTIALGGMSAGPLCIFGFLILPSLVMMPFARSMPVLYAGASLTGLLCAFGGFYLSYLQEDWNVPVSAAQLLLLGCGLLISRLCATAFGLLRDSAQARPQTNGTNGGAVEQTA